MFCVINTVHVKGNLLPWIVHWWNTDPNFSRVLMERLTRSRSGAFLTVCQHAQCNHLIFLVHPHFAGVIFGCCVSRSASLHLMWLCCSAEQAEQAEEALPASTFPLTQPFFKYTQEVFPSVSYPMPWRSGRLGGKVTSWNSHADPVGSCIVCSWKRTGQPGVRDRDGCQIKNSICANWKSPG